LTHKSSPNKILIIIAGPTAVGKSNLALYLAKLYNTEIFSADSRQVYKELSIGTAKPSDRELAIIKHHFINHISIADSYNVGMYEKQIGIALENYFIHNDVAIVCGGTGLYLRALLEGLDDFPDVPISIVEKLNLNYLEYGIVHLQEALKHLDPAYYASVDKSNPRRLIRALSIIESSGKSFSSHLSQRKTKVLPYETKPILIEKPRNELYNAINNRVDQMITQGLEAEVLNLIQYKELQALKTVGYQEWFDYFNGETERSTVIEKIKQNSRRYAKRQMTWFNKYGEWTRFNPNQLEQIISFLSL
jgi:tRNA dimethylallyltransferase